MSLIYAGAEYSPFAPKERGQCFCFADAGAFMSFHVGSALGLTLALGPLLVEAPLEESSWFVPGMPGLSQTAPVSRYGSLGAVVPPQQPAGVCGLMFAPGMVEHLKEQDCSPLAWKEVPLARTFTVSLDFSSVLCHGAVAFCPWPPLVLSPSRPSCPGDAAVWTSTEVHSGWTDRCIPPGTYQRVR